MKTEIILEDIIKVEFNVSNISDSKMSYSDFVKLMNYLKNKLNRDVTDEDIELFFRNEIRKAKLDKINGNK